MQYKQPVRTAKPGNKRPRRLIVAGLVSLLVIAGAGFLLANRHKPAAIQPSPPDSTTGSDTINLNPPTPEEKQQASDRKDEIVTQQNQTPPPGAEKQIANPTIVDAGQYGQNVEVRAFVNVVESDGQCTIIFKQGSSVITKQVAAIPDASTTRCTNLSVPRSEFAASGSWDITVAYNSAKSQGSSTSKVTLQ